MKKYVRKDCSERRSFPTREDAVRFCQWLVENNVAMGSVFQCQRCDRWHFAPTKAAAERSRLAMTRERCVSDRDLHVQLARVMGCSLETLQARVDLSKIKITGAGIEFVIVPKH